MHSNAKSVVHAPRVGAAAIVELVRARDRAVAVVLIDGRSGAGKTTLAGEVAEILGDHAEVVHLDEAYQGWDGLRAGVDAVVRHVLLPRRAGAAGRVPLWDWGRNSPGGFRQLTGAPVLIIEGVGILRPDVVTIPDITVWVEAPANLRKDRALARDGDSYRPHWNRWAEQEEEHLAAHDPASLARIVVDGVAESDEAAL